MAVRGPGMPRLTVAALVALAAFPVGSDAEAVVQPNARQIAAVVDPLIRADLAESGIPGAAFVFVRDGGIVYQQGYGSPRSPRW
jgi:CubicO group peptidase (beta-lactamase class C family)